MALSSAAVVPGTDQEDPDADLDKAANKTNLGVKEIRKVIGAIRGGVGSKVGRGGGRLEEKLEKKIKTKNL
jgi:hypothetical protein